jgi:hypothetical protein
MNQHYFCENCGNVSEFETCERCGDSASLPLTPAEHNKIMEQIAQYEYQDSTVFNATVLYESDALAEFGHDRHYWESYNSNHYWFDSAQDLEISEFESGRLGKGHDYMVGLAQMKESEIISYKVGEEIDPSDFEYDPYDRDHEFPIIKIDLGNGIVLRLDTNNIRRWGRGPFDNFCRSTEYEVRIIFDMYVYPNWETGGVYAMMQLRPFIVHDGQAVHNAMEFESDYFHYDGQAWTYGTSWSSEDDGPNITIDC